MRICIRGCAANSSTASTKSWELELDDHGVHESPDGGADFRRIYFRERMVNFCDKKKARLNCIAHLLSQFPYHEVEHPPVVLPDRERNEDYGRRPVAARMIVPDHYANA